MFENREAMRWLKTNASHAFDRLPVDVLDGTQHILGIEFEFQIQVNENDYPCGMEIVYEYCYENGRSNTVTRYLSMDYVGREIALMMIKMCQSAQYYDCYVSDDCYFLSGKVNLDFGTHAQRACPVAFELRKRK